MLCMAKITLVVVLMQPSSGEMCNKSCESVLQMNIFCLIHTYNYIALSLIRNPSIKRYALLNATLSFDIDCLVKLHHKEEQQKFIQ